MGYMSEVLEAERALFAGMLLVLIAIAGFMGTVKGFFDCLQWLGNIVACNPRGYDATKRVAIKSFFVLFSLAAVWPAGRKLFSSDCSAGRVVQVARGGPLVVNRKSGVIHFRGYSNGALPSPRWQSYSINLLRHIPYAGCERKIYEEIGLQALRQRDDCVATKAYLLAIRSSPTSYHLYDKLTRIYGRQKDYLNILKIHQDALVRLPSLKLSSRQSRRAEKEFLMRIRRTKYRAFNASQFRA